MSTPVPPSWQSTLPRYVNLAVYGMPCPLTLISIGEGTLTHMASVLFKLIVKPTWLLNMLSRSVFSWMCCEVWDNKTKSSAKSRSSSVGLIKIVTFLNSSNCFLRLRKSSLPLLLLKGRKAGRAPPPPPPPLLKVWIHHCHIQFRMKQSSVGKAFA